MKDKWTVRFIEMAFNVSRWSKDPSSKIGAVAVSADRRIIGTGFNGFSQHDDDLHEDYYIRDVKYPKVIHAEMNLLLNCLNAGVSLRGASLFVYGQPICSECAKVISNTGLEKIVVVWDHDSANTKEWAKQWENVSLGRFPKDMVIEKYHYPDNRPDDVIVAAKKRDDGWDVFRKNGVVNKYGYQTLTEILKHHDTEQRFEKFNEHLLRCA